MSLLQSILVPITYFEFLITPFTTQSPPPFPSTHVVASLPHPLLGPYARHMLVVIGMVASSSQWVKLEVPPEGVGPLP